MFSNAGEISRRGTPAPARYTRQPPPGSRCQGSPSSNLEIARSGQRIHQAALETRSTSPRNHGCPSVTLSGMSIRNTTGSIGLQAKTPKSFKAIQSPTVYQTLQTSYSSKFAGAWCSVFNDAPTLHPERAPRQNTEHPALQGPFGVPRSDGQGVAPGLEMFRPDSASSLRPNIENCVLPLTTDSQALQGLVRKLPPRGDGNRTVFPQGGAPAPTPEAAAANSIWSTGAVLRERPPGLSAAGTVAFPRWAAIEFTPGLTEQRRFPHNEL